MTLTTAPNSGSAVLRPDQVEDLVILPLLAAAVATRVSTITRTTSHNTRYPVVVSDPVTNWTAEGAEITISEPDLTEVVVTPSKLAGLTVVSNELVNDSDPSALDVVGDGLVRDLQVRLDAAYFGDTANGPDGLLSLTNVQVITWGSITDLDAFAEAMSLAETVGATTTSFVGNPLDVLALAQLKSAVDSRQPLLGMDPTQPTQRLVFGVPLISSPAVQPGQLWALPQSRVFVVVREPSEVVTDTSPFFSSDRTAVRAKLRVGFAFPHEQAIVRIDHGGS